MTRIINLKVDEQEPRLIKQRTVDEMRTIILRYKFANPVKFEGKLEELKEKYTSLGGKWSDIEKGILENKRAEVEKLETELRLVKDDKASVVAEAPKEAPKEVPKEKETKKAK